ncbi:MAG: DUF1631 family protein [Rhodoferax sp.]|uniref:DUF1631 family protein n=1 Tax=Rhodoferax sp. TaxID=50421 RepID=UPI00260F0E70|nr:DUF1631 family protein [Rhodoferax sp.]MDD5334234.1 DUF1631 family protein [Rhodoferax sp.]
MVTTASVTQRSLLSQETRKRFVTEVGRAMVELGSAVQERLGTLMNEVAPSREMQSRRDAWTLYQHSQTAWVEGTLKSWQEALKPVAKPKKTPDAAFAFELVATDVAENKILASRLALGVMEKAAAEVNDLHLRIRHLENTQELENQDILRPEILLLPMVERWAGVGLSREVWQMVNDSAAKLLTERLQQAYANGNAFLIKQGVLPTIELADRVTRVPTATGRPVQPGAKAPADAVPAAPTEAEKRGEPPGYAGDAGARSAPGQPMRGQEFAGRPGAPGQPRSGAAFGGRLGWDNGAATGQPDQRPAQRYSSDMASAAEETRMMTGTTPLARARSRAIGVVGQLRRLLVTTTGTNFETTAHQAPSPALAAAIAVPPAGPAAPGPAHAAVAEDYSQAGVARVSADLRRRTTDLKNKAETKNEKAVIEIVALMFQAILQEDRIPPAIRVWFARLQMPVLRVALMEPDFFGTLDHPARQLIDRMGSCVMGFDASGINGSALETEIKRIVQVIEQYPETGKRVYQLVYDEFQTFLSQFLTGRGSTQKVVGVAQQVELKETLTIQYTIEMRNMLKDMPVRESIRQFLFKVWAEVLAVAAVRKGPQHAETLGLKKLATDLIWAASAKPNRSDRTRVIRDLPLIQQKLRAGMTLLGVTPAEQEAHIKTVSDTLADAFVSKTQAIPNEQIAAMAERLTHLEDFVTDEGMGDLPLDAQGIEMMLGLDASNIDVVTDGGSKPTAAMLAWAQELQVGAWFTLDHNGRVAQVQFVWRSERKHLNLFASSDGRSYLIQARRLAAYLQAGLLLPQEQETLTVRATRDALGKLSANPERLLG